MLVVETIARIRRDHLVRGVPIKKIARDLKGGVHVAPESDDDVTTLTASWTI